MNIQDAWEKALHNTRIVRSRALGLHAFEDTKLPYLFLAESLVNRGDTVVRRGEVLVEKPAILLPSSLPKFEGFRFEEELGMSEDFLTNFLLVRGVLFPSLKYNNKNDKLDVFTGPIEKAVEHHGNLLQRQEDTATGLVTGTEDTWQLSVLIFICGQVARSAESDFKKLWDDLRRRTLMS